MSNQLGKTERIIEATFLELRKKKPLEKIHVNAICEKAEINKSTFYRHYEDIYALNDRVENRFLDEAFQTRFKLISMTGKTFLVKVLRIARDEYGETMMILFRDRQEVLLNKVGQRLKDIFLTEDAGAKAELVNSFIFSGSVHALFDQYPDIRKMTDDDINTYAETISSLLKTIYHDPNVKGLITDSILNYFQNKL